MRSFMGKSKQTQVACTACAKNIKRQCQLAAFVLLVHCLYLQKTYISSFKLFSVYTLHNFCTVCTFFVCMFEFYVHFLYIYYNTKFGFVQSLYTIYIYTNLVFSMIFVYILYNFCMFFLLWVVINAQGFLKLPSL